MIIHRQNFDWCIGRLFNSLKTSFMPNCPPRKSFTAFWQSLNSSRDLELSSSWWKFRQSLLLFQCSLYNEYRQNIRCHCWESSKQNSIAISLFGNMTVDTGEILINKRSQWSLWYWNRGPAQYQPERAEWDGRARSRWTLSSGRRWPGQPQSQDRRPWASFCKRLRSKLRKRLACQLSRP